MFLFLAMHVHECWLVVTVHVGERGEISSCMTLERVAESAHL